MFPGSRCTGFTLRNTFDSGIARIFVRAVDCQECHEDMTQQTVAVRSKNLNMNFCISCHRAKGASADCMTCHY